MTTPATPVAARYGPPGPRTPHLRRLISAGDVPVGSEARAAMCTDRPVRQPRPPNGSHTVIHRPATWCSRRSCPARHDHRVVEERRTACPRRRSSVLSGCWRTRRRRQCRGWGVSPARCTWRIDRRRPRGLGGGQRGRRRVRRCSGGSGRRVRRGGRAADAASDIHLRTIGIVAESRRQFGESFRALTAVPYAADLRPGAAQLRRVELEGDDYVGALRFGSSSTSRSVACWRPSASILVIPFNSPPRSDFSQAPNCEPTFRDRTVRPKTSPNTSSIS